VPLSEVLAKIIQEVGTETLSFYHPSRDFIINDEVMDDERMKRVGIE
jgi:hypothetical protein